MNNESFRIANLLTALANDEWLKNLWRLSGFYMKAQYGQGKGIITPAISGPLLITVLRR